MTRFRGILCLYALDLSQNQEHTGGLEIVDSFRNLIQRQKMMFSLSAVLHAFGRIHATHGAALTL